MADRYWVGGTATWDNTAGTKWSTTSGGAGGASVPTSSDNVYFDAGGIINITIAPGGMPSASLTIADTFGGNISGTVLVYGSVFVGDNKSCSGLSITMSGTGGAATIKSPVAPLQFNTVVINAGGKTISTANPFTATTLEILLGGFVVNHDVRINNFNTTGTSSRSLNWGTSSSIVWTVTGVGAIWYCVDTINFAISGDPAVEIRFTHPSSSRAFYGGGRTWPVIVNSGTGPFTIWGNNTFAGLKNTISPAFFTFGSLIGSVATQVVTNFNVNGTPGNLVTVNSYTSGTKANLSKPSGIVSSSYLSIKDIGATGGAGWYAVNSTDGGNNTGWVFGPPPSGNMLAFFV